MPTAYWVPSLSFPNRRYWFASRKSAERWITRRRAGGSGRLPSPPELVVHEEEVESIEGMKGYWSTFSKEERLEKLHREYSR